LKAMMNKAYNTSYSRSCGMTLVEVLAGMALIGTLLVGILLAEGRATQQQAQAGRRVHACALADGLLSEWTAPGQSVPRESQGRVSGHPQWAWRTRVVKSSLPEELDCEVISVELYVADVATPMVDIEIVQRKGDEK
jgi:prepilin-type N-terminal cleavage/methylation domain-containing protein